MPSKQRKKEQSVVSDRQSQGVSHSWSLVDELMLCSVRGSPNFPRPCWQLAEVGWGKSEQQVTVRRQGWEQGGPARWSEKLRRNHAGSQHRLLNLCCFPGCLWDPMARAWGPHLSPSLCQTACARPCTQRQEMKLPAMGMSRGCRLTLRTGQGVTWELFKTGPIHPHGFGPGLGRRQSSSSLRPSFQQVDKTVGMNWSLLFSLNLLRLHLVHPRSFFSCCPPWLHSAEMLSGSFGNLLSETVLIILTALFLAQTEVTEGDTNPPRGAGWLWRWPWLHVRAAGIQAGCC